MILLAGIPDESPMQLVREALDDIDVPYLMFDQRNALQMDISLEISSTEDCGNISGTLNMGDREIGLEEILSLYLRLMDDQSLPQVLELAAESPERKSCRNLHDILYRWSDIAPIRVLNRPSNMASNRSKPFQAHIIRRHGLLIPETLITNDPMTAKAFCEIAWEEGENIIYKSISGVRSIVEQVAKKDLSRLDSIRWCPTQFQRFVQGDDIRVHTVGEQCFATRINSDATDYRYASQQINRDAELAHIELEPVLYRRCINLAKELGLPLAGIDLRITPDNEVYCFEVNPSPAFSYYERRTGTPISRAIALYLAGQED